MNKLLESIWYDYAVHNMRQTGEMKAVSERLSRSREVLMGELNSWQKSALFEFEENLNELHAVYEKEAFVRGVRFAVGIFLDSVHG